MGVIALRTRLAGVRTVLLDTMVFAYHLADHPDYSPLTAVVLGAVESGPLTGLATVVTLAELLTQPARAGDRRAMQEYELFLTHFPHLQLARWTWISRARPRWCARRPACARRTRSRWRPAACTAPTPS